MSPDGNGPSVFRPGDTVCFIGDSITHCGSIHSLIYLYWLTRFPGTDLTFWNCGRAGGVTHQATARYDREIAPLRPTVAALMFGMNDCGRHRYGVTHETAEDLASRAAHFEEFKLRTRLLVERLQADGCRIILQTPTPYDQTALDRPGWPADGRVTPGHEHANDALGRFAEWLRQVAPAWGATVVDYHRPFTELSLQLQAVDPAFSLTGDRVHPEMGWFLMAACEFLTQTGMPATVAEARIDAAALRSESVTELQRQADGISFTWQAGALPFPVAPVYRPVAERIRFHERLNRETLTVTGLPRGQYELLIDGADVGVFEATALAVGVNLGVLEQTPQYQQAVELMRRNDERQALNESLQDVHMIDCFRPDGQTDAELLEAARREAGRSGEPGRAWWAKVYRNYVEFHNRIAETHEELWARMRELNALNRPVAHRYRLRRAG